MARGFVSAFLRQDAGFVLSSEALLMCTSVVLGLLVRLVSVRDSLVTELKDFSQAIGFLNQSYSYTGVTDNGGVASTQGGVLADSLDGDDAPPLLFVFEDPET